VLLLHDEPPALNLMPRALRPAGSD